MEIHIHRPSAPALTLTAHTGQTLAQALWLSGKLAPPPLCSGLGQCGRCRVRFLENTPAPSPEERRLLSPEALNAGERLACRHQTEHLAQHISLELFPAPPRRIVPATGRIPKNALRLAVDLGTTSLHWRVITPEGCSVSSGEELNPQMGAGADIMSRLAMTAAPEGAQRLAILVHDALRRILEELPAPVEECCIAGNSAMSAIFLQKECDGLRHAPYHLPYAGNTVEQLPQLPPCYLPAQLAPFVGGDITAGLLAVEEECAHAWPFLLVDMGTNGEFLLARAPGDYLATSVPLGPAIEGIGLRFGDVAGPGVAAGFSLTPAGLTAITPDGVPPRRICATGYLSLLRILLQIGLLDPDGHFVHHSAHPLGHNLGKQIVRVMGEERLPLPGGLYCGARDIEEVLKVKAAFSLALEELLHAGGLPPAALCSIFVAGALGEHVLPRDLEALGFFTPGMGTRLRAVGNSSLRGAELLLSRPALRTRMEDYVKGCRILDLISRPSFTTDYLRHMRFGQV